MDIKGYFARRFQERSTKLGLAIVGVMVLKLALPEYAFAIDQIALLLGVTTAAVPDKPKP